jgi:geranylgeranyl diphosphate synthase type II
MSSTGSLSGTSQKTAMSEWDPAVVRQLVEGRLDDHLTTPTGVPASLSGAMRHALLAPSKRVRPVLLFLVAEPEDGQTQTVLDVGCAVEMVHTASLILDDLPCMDDAQMRRQRPTTHVAFGQATAILGAIALLTRAFGIIAGLDDVPPHTRARLAQVLAEAVGWDGLVAGQEIDVNGRSAVVEPVQIDQLNWLKTGVLFVAAAEMGAILRGLEDERIASIRLFARHFGLAFQTADDLLDQSSVAVAGKDVNKDTGKTTLVTLFGAGKAEQTCRQHIADAEAALAASGINAAPVRALMTRVLEAGRMAKK